MHNTDTSLSSLFHERELALVVDDISALIEEVQATPHEPQVDKTRFGHLSGKLSPCGVSLVLVHSDSPLRHAVAPFASSIAARNTVILATTENGRFFELFRQHAREYLDASALHVVQMNQDDVDVEQIDHVLVVGKFHAARIAASGTKTTPLLMHCLGEDRSKWSALLASPKAFFCPVVGGLNVAVIGEGPIAAEKLAQLLITADDQSQHMADILTTVFVHTENMPAMTSALANTSHKTPFRLNSAVASGGLSSQVYALDLTSTRATDLSKILTSAREARALVLIEATSLDQVIDSARKIGNIKQLALLNPASPGLAAYFERWTQSAIITTEGFLPTTPSCKCATKTQL